MRHLFGVELDEPTYISERGEVTMTYHARLGIQLDLAASGRGMQQTLMLLSHLADNPGAVMLLDEPDAHLDILRQRQIHQVLTETARAGGSQIIAASHSEVIPNEAASRDVVVAFVGVPHRIDDRGSQVLKALREIGFEDYYQAEVTGWVLYLEGATDWAILLAFAETLGHAASADLARPFVKYVLNQPCKAREHYSACARRSGTFATSRSSTASTRSWSPGRRSLKRCGRAGRSRTISASQAPCAPGPKLKRPADNPT
jgi:hypothetical protein